jgi:hypothetical protein
MVSHGIQQATPLGRLNAAIPLLPALRSLNLQSQPAILDITAGDGGFRGLAWIFGLRACASGSYSSRAGPVCGHVVMIVVAVVVVVVFAAAAGAGGCVN